MAAKVYKLITEDEEHSGYNYEVPSMEFLMESLENIENILTQHIKDSESHNNTKPFNGLDVIASDIETLPTEDKISTIRAENVKIDNRHQFLTKQQITDFKNKPSMEDMNIKIEEIKNNLKSYFYDLYIQLLNMPDAVNKLKAVSTVLKEDNDLNSLISTMSINSTDALEEHINDGSHLSGDDRRMIDAIYSALDCGISWNNTEGLYISDKPESLKADGGNADTVCGLSIDKLANRREYDIYVGIESGAYSQDEVDVFFRKHEEINVLLENSGSYFFRIGNYKTKSFIINTTKGVCVTGVDGLTNITFVDNPDPMIIPDNCVIRNITLTNGDIEIGSNCKFYDVTFDNCNITLNRTNNTNIENCTIKGTSTKYRYIGSCMNNIITHNRVTGLVKVTFNYHGGNNLIGDNIFT